MTEIEVRDKATGLSLQVREFVDTPLPLPIAAEFEAKAMARFGQSLDAELAALRADIEAAERRWSERYGIREVEVEHVWADLPPDPVLELAPDRLEAEAQARMAQERRRRRDVLSGAVEEREEATQFVPKVPWRQRVKRGVVLYLEQRKAEKELT